MEQGAREAAEKRGVEIVVKTPPSENDIAAQVQLLNALVAQGVEVIVIAPSSKEALTPPLAALAAKGMKIVIVDSSLGSDGPGVFVGSDQHAAGEAAGTFLGSLMPDGGEITFLKHNQTSSAAAEREQGALERLRASHPKAVIHGDIYASTEKGVEAERAALVLSKYPETKGIIATSSSGTLAMIEVLRAKKAGGTIKFVGFGYNLTPAAAEAIEQDIMQGWVAQLPHRIGAQGIETAIALTKGENVPPVVYTPVVIITKDNLHQPEIQALLAR